MRIINKQYIFLLILTLFLIVSSSCKKSYLDVNSDPNRVTDANITAELIFPAAATEVGGLAARNASSFFDQWVGYAAPSGGFVPQQNLISYNIDYTFADGLFQAYYNALFDLHLAETKALSSASQDTVLAGASIVLSVKLFQEVTDIFGDVPYSQAFNVTKYTSPTYDKSQDIYNSLLLRLDTAITYLKFPTTAAFTKADIINNGQTAKWIALANTLRLRLLIRQSQVSPGIPSAEIAKITSNGGVLGAGQSVTVNPGYVNDVNKQNPYFAAKGFTPTGTQADLATDANNYIVNILSSTNDPRLDRFFFPAGFDSANGIVGNTFGDAIGTLAQANQSSYFGPAVIGNVSVGNGADPANKTKGGIPDGSGATRGQTIYPSYESLFLYAEAVGRGWIPGNLDAQAALNAAITESFIWTGVPNASNAAAAYISGNKNITNIPPDTMLTAKAQIIVYQKYLANTNIDPLESFLDINRLHFLTDNSYISTYSAKISSTLPLRLLYPQSEYTTNSKNVPAEVIGDIFTKKLFWEP
jgi:hypothetical protein